MAMWENDKNRENDKKYRTGGRYNPATLRQGEKNTVRIYGALREAYPVLKVRIPFQKLRIVFTLKKSVRRLKILSVRNNVQSANSIIFHDCKN
jgi:hypothetical protein